jgi:hypothetical protein
MGEVLAARHAYLESLVVVAVEDSKVTSSERRDPDAVNSLLGMDQSVLEALLVRVMEDRG